MEKQKSARRRASVLLRSLFVPLLVLSILLSAALFTAPKQASLATIPHQWRLPTDDCVQGSPNGGHGLNMLICLGGTPGGDQ